MSGIAKSNIRQSHRFAPLPVAVGTRAIRDAGAIVDDLAVLRAFDYQP